MGHLSKLLPYTCYELGHCWNPHCAVASLEVCIIGFLNSLQIYGVVYLLTALVNAKKISLKYGLTLLKQYVTSVLFLTVNAFGYIGSFCVLRHVLRHINLLTASFLPGFIGSLMAIFVERPERRVLLATYVTNVASECLWNTAVGNGYVRPIPRGDLLLFAIAMAVLGYTHRSSRPLSRMIDSVFKLLLGSDECGVRMAERQAVLPNPRLHSTPQSWWKQLKQFLCHKHQLCPHSAGCLPHFFWTAAKGFGQGFMLQLGVKVVGQAGRLVRSPSLLYQLLTSKTNVQAGVFMAWLTAVFKGVCCSGRWLQGRESTAHGAVAGLLAAPAMYFYSAPSLTLYLFWKVLESLYERFSQLGYLPQVPYSVELIYALSTGYLFHISAVEVHYMKPSYWRFLRNLTWDRLHGYNRHLLEFGLDSARNYQGFWPDYDSRYISARVKAMGPGQAKSVL